MGLAGYRLLKYAVRRGDHPGEELTNQSSFSPSQALLQRSADVIRYVSASSLTRQSIGSSPAPWPEWVLGCMLTNLDCFKSILAGCCFTSDESSLYMIILFQLTWDLGLATPGIELGMKFTLEDQRVNMIG